MSASATATYEWHQLPWRTLESAVFTLERRLYNASHAGDSRRVHSLQRLLLKSQAAKRLAVRRVTHDNHGQHTAGSAGVKSRTPRQRAAVAERLGTLPLGRPTRRVGIPKPGTDERRPVSSPTRHDRALHALVTLALEPAWEARFEPNSDGFRPGRAVHEAIGAMASARAKHPQSVWDAESAKGFDRIDPAALLDTLKTFPTLTRGVKAWLTAGVLAHGVFTATERGTPQGGVLSPWLANIALHGREASLRTRFPARTRRNPAPPGRQLHGQPQGIRYADDLVVLHRARAVIEPCRQLTPEWRQGRGLERSEQKTRIAHTLAHVDGEAGFTVLGFQARRAHASQDHTSRGRGFKTLIRPSPAAEKRHGARLSEPISQHKAAQPAHRIGGLNPVIAGGANYSRAVVSPKTCHRLDHRRYEQLRRWAFFRHPRHGRRRVIRRYWDTPPGQSWAFRDSDGPP
jgi:RNA-directed DNA polymerase